MNHLSGEIEAPAVVYVAGYGRSGSTLLDRLLGSHRSVRSAGEVGHLIDFSEQLGAMTCGCGAVVAECSYWSETTRTIESIDSPPAPARRKLERAQGLLRLIVRRWLRKPVAPEDAAYGRFMFAMFKALRRDSGVETVYVVDSSKTTMTFAGRPVALADTAGLNVRIVHVIRDGRGVLWSVIRRRESLHGPTGRSGRLRLAIKTTLNWTLSNSLAVIGGIALPAGCYVRVRYEDLVKDPGHTLRGLLEWLEIDAAGLDSMLYGRETWPLGHQLAGNRMMRRADLVLREDTEWRRALGLPLRAIFWVLGGPCQVLIHRRTRGVSYSDSRVIVPHAHD